ncbi:MAG: hypothetical protein MUE60_07200 [Candidatus Eisenbacteria bacterium]|nr:hypothetical protein [Candidatus Eisenbacteria bacterium]
MISPGLLTQDLELRTDACDVKGIRGFGAIRAAGVGRSGRQVGDAGEVCLEGDNGGVPCPAIRPGQDSGTTGGLLFSPGRYPEPGLESGTAWWDDG